jgi:hypothetical protein
MGMDGERDSSKVHERVITLYQQGGFEVVARQSIVSVYQRYLRKALPKHNGTWRGRVEVTSPPYQRTRLDRFVERIGWDYSAGYSDAMAWDFAVSEIYAQPGDHVMVIGGGNGVSAVIASQVVGKDGRVTSFEGSVEYFDYCSESFVINDTPAPIDNRHALITESGELYHPDAGGAEIIDPAELPTCDVLQMNCQGAESDIIPTLRIKPRVIHVQVHECFGASLEKIRAELEKRGYTIVVQDPVDTDLGITDIVARRVE